jgi:hypothetical protein
MPLFDPTTDFIAVCRKDRSANTFYRKITSVVNFLLIKLLFGTEIGDFQFVQVYRRKILYNINIKARGTFVPPELMIRALGAGFGMKQYRTHFYARSKGKAKCGHPKVIIRTILDMLVLWFELNVNSCFSRKKVEKAGHNEIAY